MVKIYLDAGHGGSDPGAVGNGLLEKVLTLKIAKRVETLLADYENAQTKMSRTGDTYPSLSDRTNEANKWGADYFLSFHINAGGGTGYEDFVFTGSSKSIAYQNIMHEEIVKKICKMKNRGKKQADYQVLRKSNMPSLLTEGGFIDNTSDAALLKQDTFIEDFAQGHVNGLVKAFGLKKKEGVVEVAKVEFDKEAKPSASLAVEFKLAVAAGITDGTYPQRPATREEVAVMVYRATKK
jgi:N-acetylmuramoyl-L-alanine amidase